MKIDDPGGTISEIKLYQNDEELITTTDLENTFTPMEISYNTNYVFKIEIIWFNSITSQPSVLEDSKLLQTKDIAPKINSFEYST